MDKKIILKSDSKNFALIGAAGYIAPRHMKAIKDNGHEVVAALDPFDSVGIIDSYFPNADFFTKSERFDRHLDKKRRNGNGKIDYVSICSPNYLHDAHIRMVLRNQSHAICEKPIVLNPWNIDALQEIEKESGKHIYNILQLRLHQSIIDLKRKIDLGPKDKIYDIDLVYITARGNWYNFSWKGNTEKSGGIATNIGVHFFDMLSYIFGKCKSSKVHLLKPLTNSGYLELERARIRWFLSIDQKSLAEIATIKNQRTFRSIKIDGKEIEFSGGFTNLHNLVYKDILSGNGFSLEDARPSIEIVHQIRNATVLGRIGEYHPFLKNCTR